MSTYYRHDCRFPVARHVRPAQGNGSMSRRIGPAPVTLSRDGVTVRAAMGRDGMIHAGRLCGLASAWEHRGWTVTLTAA